MNDAQRTGEFIPTLGERGTMDSVIVKWSVNVNTSSACPVLGDIDGDNAVEAVVGGTDSCVYVLNGIDGTTRWKSNQLSGPIYNSAAALGDIDGNTNTIEIVIGAHNGVIFALDGNGGNVRWSRVVGIEFASSPVLGNVDGNASTIEIVVGLRDTTVCLNGVDGSVKWKVKTGLSWNQGGANQPCSPAIADLDNDGNVEVVTTSTDGSVQALNGNDGGLKWRCVTQTISGDTSSFYPSLVPAIAIKDVDNDNIKEIATHHGSNIYLIGGASGNIKWSSMTGYSMGTAVNSGVALADIDSDSKSEVIFRNGRIVALDESAGSTLWSYSFPGCGLVMPSPVLADLDGDTKLEVVAADHDGYVACLEGENGALKWSIHITTGDIHPTHGIGDIDGDGCIEIVGASCYGPVYALEAGCPQAVEETSVQTECGLRALYKDNKVFVFFNLNGVYETSVSIFDVCGREKAQLNMGRLGKGSYEANLNASDLTNNIYFVKLAFGERSLTHKVVLIK